MAPTSRGSNALFPFPQTRIIHTNNFPKPVSTADMSYSAFLTFLFWQGFRASTALAQKCYAPNGDACNPTSSNQVSACCAPPDTCLSNGLCLGADMTPSRGSCTDRTWKSTGCAQWCSDGKTTHTSGTQSVCFIDQCVDYDTLAQSSRALVSRSSKSKTNYSAVAKILSTVRTVPAITPLKAVMLPFPWIRAVSYSIARLAQHRLIIIPRLLL